ncbi:DB module [Ancylostoma duodenale]|uniref:DB module n=1 Tax=Ancylostoma duodenale TaxID=51022 RepID=A0A0C2G895_9BILA|nr:DB module [Ancylostoma duodenale]
MPNCARESADHHQRLGAACNGDTLDPRDDGNIFGLQLWNKTDLNINKENIARYTVGKTFSDFFSGQEENCSTQNPNFLFHSCCEERRLPAACVQRCHFNTYEKEVLESMFVGTDECPIDFLPEMQFCAAQGMDHRKCCAATGVADTAAGDKCLTFCDQRPDLYTPINYSYAPCYDRFENMKRCFYNEIRGAAEKHFIPMVKNTTP